MNEAVREGFVTTAQPVETPAERLSKPAAIPPPAKPVQPPAAPPEPALRVLSDTWPITVRLVHKTLRGAKGEDIKELTFREPTARDVLQCGFPVSYNESLERVINDEKMFNMIVRLSGQFLPVIERMDPRDLQSIVVRLSRFFQGETTGWFPE
jgi:hypothetical protein